MSSLKDRSTAIDVDVLGPNQRRWVNALRSGNYRQTAGSLRVGDAYCCLGVVSDIYKPEWRRAGDVGPSGCNIMHHGDSTTAFLPVYVQEWLGAKTRECFFRPKIPFLCDGTGQISLAALNDNHVPFTQIADIIEAFASELFTERK